MWLGNLRRLALIVLGGSLVGGTVLYTNARSGQATREPAEPPAPQASSKDEDTRRTEIPAPRKVRVASGRGKAALYALDPEGNRIRNREAGDVVRFQEAEREIRWAVITGVIDHQQVPKAWIAAHRKMLPDAESIYRRVDLQRRTLQKDGTWSGWKMVDAEANYTILDNLPVVEEERVPEHDRLELLVDPLPHLTQGRWEGVDVEEFLPSVNERRKDLRAEHLPRFRAQRDLPPILMIRALDFTVEPGRVYRYRARVILDNPYFNRARSGVNRWLQGPWSEASEVITVPRPEEKP
jgi:hypothetical protein